MKTILNNVDYYKRWRDEKLKNASTTIDKCLVEISHPFVLSVSEKSKISVLCSQHNFALYRVKNVQHVPQSTQIKKSRKSGQKSEYFVRSTIAINQQLGLKNYDKHLFAKSNGLAYISCSEDGENFIPYTNQLLNWHTDGYYNGASKRIRSFSLFCVSRAAAGGENYWIDHELVYILLREKNLDFIKALEHPSAMSIPKHQVGKNIRRPATQGAVFFIDMQSGKLMMRYTKRKHNVIWANIPFLNAAKIALEKILDSSTPYHFRYLMQQGEGFLCNNILHRRSAFSENKTMQRLILRGRYFERIA